MATPRRQQGDRARRRGATYDQVKADIDSGRTGDKIPAADPGAAPLGTDAEVSGTPTPPDAIAQTRRLERRNVGRHEALHQSQSGGTGRHWLWAIVAGVLGVAAVTAAMFIALPG